MKTSLIFFLSLLILAVSPIQGSTKEKNGNDALKTATILKGKVTDRLSGEELAGVKVRLAGTDLETFTGFDGEFRFENLVPGSYELEISLVSYRKALSEKLDLKPGESRSLLIELKPQ